MLKSTLIFFCALLVAAMIFIAFSSRDMPTVVASHFGASGEANGFMSRSNYVIFMLAFALALPSVLLFFSSIALRRPSTKINLPNHDYWLMPERREATLEYIQTWLVRFGCMLVTLMCFVHWCVVRANSQQPTHLNLALLLVGLGIFLVTTILWVMALHRRFRRSPGT